MSLRGGFAGSTQVEVETEFPEVVFPTRKLGNEPQGDFFGVHPKKVSFF
jgi:hypothetical protein